MAYLVKTTGKFYLLSPNAKEEINYDRPHVVHNQLFVELLVGRRQIRVIDADLSEKATDKEFEKYWREFAESATQERSAIASFLTKYGTPVAFDKEPEAVEFIEPPVLESEEEIEAEAESEAEEKPICPVCDSTFVKKNSRQKYCSPECSKKKK